MDTFALIVTAAIVLGLAFLLWLGWLWRAKSHEDITDKGRYERIAGQMEIEESEVPLMIEAANGYRRKRGRPEITRDDPESGVELEQLTILAEAQKALGAKSAGNSGRKERGF